MRHRAKFRRNRLNRVRDMVIFKMAVVRNVEFVLGTEPPTKTTWWYLSQFHSAKFGWNQYSTFDNVEVILRVWLENA